MHLLFSVVLLATLASADVFDGPYYIANNRTGHEAAWDGTREGDAVQFKASHQPWEFEEVSHGLHPWYVITGKSSYTYPPYNPVWTQIGFPEYKDGAVARLQSSVVPIFEITSVGDELYKIISNDSPTRNPSEKLAWTVERLSAEDQTEVLKLRPYRGTLDQHFNVIKAIFPP
ncbi:predicted protein [Uncinocarpus reesii 1704]|uniref:Uncharacterized protein n=1 Tax=Uncinocarpus reesii (strain UAMH 1704) TaxID=336963 RepID=C4JX50_UNCRE|nr:uncharacterized protein UREG_06223 [Uncinocarpus reesii 1704]EEP81358.1 predicted protein [Uncinocarpus reesii 1704]